MKNDIFSNLNSKQLQAVMYTGQNVLILAGAGSGKTRVIVYRIAWLLSQGININNILAVTFTNKAAKEMKDRLEKILCIPINLMWVGTFHNLAHKLLRIHWKEAELNKNFQIIDTNDQIKLIKSICHDYTIDINLWPIQQFKNFININKSNGVRSNEFIPTNYNEEILLKIYKQYEIVCNCNNFVDFNELLLRICELFKKNLNIKQLCREKFQYIFVDEFQDTNKIQYTLIKELLGDNSNLTIVGDDDQSIYGWRGANPGNMLRLSHDYPNIHTIRLEQNYRSTFNIISAANTVINNNTTRLGKKLWTEKDKGELITIYTASSELDEAQYIIEKIQFWIKSGKKLKDLAILYRSNAQSRIIEEQLLRSEIPYKIYGGLRFFERAEIKDVLAYIRLIANNNDDISFERIINIPTRGIGEVTLKALKNIAKQNKCSLWQATKITLINQELSKRILQILQKFVDLINECINRINILNLSSLISYIIDITNLREYYTKFDRQSRIENIDEIIIAAEQYSLFVQTSNNLSLLQEFLSHISLESEDASDHCNNENYVTLMSMHAAKGLEFSIVFLCGMEEGLFPHIKSIINFESLEEERRLFYVGITRAMDKLYMLYSKKRLVYGHKNERQPSRFLSEIPLNLIFNDNKNDIQKLDHNDMKLCSTKNYHFYLGQKVVHPYFGEGIINKFEGEGEYFSVTVNFRKFGKKSILPKYLSNK